ncbi:hypothetical protein D030_3347A, partial [Vibrio parahaemolyticus AQ3810]
MEWLEDSFQSADALALKPG